MADDILQNFVDSKAYNFPPVKDFLREVLAGLVLQMTITSCSKPEWINGWIVYLLEEVEPELLNVIDESVGNMTGNNAEAVERTRHAADQAMAQQKRRISSAEQAMQQAMDEAKRLNEMIAEDEARRKRETGIAEGDETASQATTETGIATPTSSDSGHARERSIDSSFLLMDETTRSVLHQAPVTSITFDQMTTQLSANSDHGSYTPPAMMEPTLPILSLHNASITIYDDAEPSDRSTMRSKPLTEYMLQIGPSSGRFPGWMITRKYEAFESIHESLRRISPISGAAEFNNKHPSLPSWRGQSKPLLTQNLERYLKAALSYEPLAESEAMKKFLEKETGLDKAPKSAKNILPFQAPKALDDIGKGFVNVGGQGAQRYRWRQ